MGLFVIGIYYMVVKDVEISIYFLVWFYLNLINNYILKIYIVRNVIIRDRKIWNSLRYVWGFYKEVINIMIFF